MVCPLGIPFYYSVSLSINQGKCSKKTINFFTKYMDFPKDRLYNREIMKEVKIMSVKYVFVTGGVVSGLGKGDYRRLSGTSPESQRL